MLSHSDVRKMKKRFLLKIYTTYIVMQRN